MTSGMPNLAALFGKAKPDAQKTETLESKVDPGVEEQPAAIPENTAGPKASPFGGLFSNLNAAKQSESTGTSIAVPDATDPATVSTDTEESQTSTVAVVEVATGPAGFQAKLDKLDSLIGADNSISSLVIDQVRGHVKEIAIELHKFPEYDGILLDRDIHNIMAFMQQSVSTSAESFKAKAKAKSTKAASAKIRSTVDFGALDSALGAAVTKDVNASPPAKTMDLGFLASFDASSINPKK